MSNKVIIEHSATR